MPRHPVPRGAYLCRQAAGREGQLELGVRALSPQGCKYARGLSAAFFQCFYTALMDFNRNVHIR